MIGLVDERAGLNWPVKKVLSTLTLLSSRDDSEIQKIG